MPIDASIPLQVRQPENPLEQYGRALALQNALGQQQIQQQQIQQNQLEMQKQQIALRGQQALDQVMQTAFTKDADGNLTINRDAVTKGLSAAGQGHQIPGVLKGFNEMDEAAAKLKKAQTDSKTASDEYTARSLLTIADHDYDPTIALGVLGHAAELGILPADQAKLMAGQIAANQTPETVKELIDPLLSRSEQYQKLVDARNKTRIEQQNADTNAARETRESAVSQAEQDRKAYADLAGKLGATKTPQEYEAVLGAAPFKLAQQFVGKTAEQARRMGMTAEQQAQAEQQKATFDERQRHNKQMEANDNAAPMLTPEGLDMAAKSFVKTGQLPPMGMGKAGAATRAAIINRASALDKGADLALNKADYEANKKSLDGLQKQFDSVTAFEKTAGKNLDTFLNTAKKVVDSGSPWVNRPLREIGQNALGGEDLAAFNAARVTAVNEIAKVLNNPSSSAALSDSARKEVQELIGPNASLKQIVKAADVLKQDMENRKTAYSEQIDAIKTRIGGGQKNETTQAAPKATHRYNPKTGQIEPI